MKNFITKITEKVEAEANRVTTYNPESWYEVDIAEYNEWKRKQEEEEKQLAEQYGIPYGEEVGDVTEQRCRAEMIREECYFFKIVKYEPRQIFTDGIFYNLWSGDDTITNVAVYFALHSNSADGLHNCLEAR